MQRGQWFGGISAVSFTNGGRVLGLRRLRAMLHHEWRCLCGHRADVQLGSRNLRLLEQLGMSSAGARV
jgi:hypothetical protein